MGKFSNVKNFFEKDVYLKNRTNIFLRKAIVSDLLGEIINTSIIDIGCGDGSISLQFAKENKITLVDGSEYMIDKAKGIAQQEGYENVEFFNQDLYEFRIDKKYQVVICIGVVSHVDDPVKLLSMMHNLLDKNGVIIIQYSDIEHFYYRNFIKNKRKNEKDYGYELNTFTQDSFNELLMKNGFQIAKRTGYSWPVKPFSYLPFKIQFGILNLMRQWKYLSFFNSEKILVINKEETEK